MKYSNSLKYMNGFQPSESSADISQKRAALLCTSLGKINVGLRSIYLPSSGSGHALAVMLEAVMLSAGHRVGRITSAFDFDSRASVYICGEIPSIEDYNGAVEELKSAVKRNPDVAFTREETTFALGLLLCRMTGCEYVILEGLSGSDYSLDALCAPYELIVMPTVYGNSAVCDIKCLCEAIKRETREVVSGNQKSEVYNTISNACAMSGARLYIPVKAQFEVKEVSSRNLSFSYVGRDGFSIKNPSYMLRDLAITVIESALALRRGGVRLPWSSIIEGLSSVTNTGCFDMLSLSPKMILDTATFQDEAALVIKTADELWGAGALDGTTVCVTASSLGALGAFKEGNIGEVVVFDSGMSVDLPEGAKSLDTLQKVAKEVSSNMFMGKNVVCFGDVGFISSLKAELLKLMNG